MGYHLQIGYLLQNRYRVEAILGQGGFGITYLCKTIWSGSLVAVKEFFWNGFMQRAEDGQTVALLSDNAAEQVKKMRRRFLQEAKTLQQLENISSIVHVLDYFEENNTAYMVTAYIDGATLSKRLSEAGPMEASALFHKVLPLLRDLACVHRAGFLHRDISADNLMLHQDGTLILVDFGAARDFSGMSQGQISQYIKGSYSPPEQYSPAGNLSPASDLYALSAVLYQTVTGQMPPMSLARLQSDTIRWPSEQGISIGPKLEQVLKKGLALRPEERYQSADEMARDIAQALSAHQRRRRRIGTAVILTAVLLITAATVWLSRRDVFDGIETEQIYLIYPERLSYDDRKSAVDTASRLADAFSGGLYTVEKRDNGLLLTLPLASFSGREIKTAVKENFLYRLPDGFTSLCEVQATWLPPEGEYQVERDALEGEILLISTGSSGYLEDASQYEIDLQNFMIRQRLDALETPYAIGTLYGTSHQPVIAMGTDHLSRWVLQILGNSAGSIIVRGEHRDEVSLSFVLFEDAVTVLEADGRCGLQCNMDTASLLTTLRERGETTVYMTLNRDCLDLFHLSEELPLAYAAIPPEGAPLEFWDFYLSDGTVLTADQRWFAEYIAQATLRDFLPSSFWVEDLLLVNENKKIQWDAEPTEIFGMQMAESPEEAALAALAETMQADGLDTELRDGRLLIYLHLPESASMFEAGLEEATRLCEKYQLHTYKGSIQIFIWDTLKMRPYGGDYLNNATRCGYVLLQDALDSDEKIVTAAVVSPEIAGQRDVLQKAWDALNWPSSVAVNELEYSVEATLLYFDLYV